MKAVVKSGKEFQPRLKQLVVINNEVYGVTIKTFKSSFLVKTKNF